MRRGIVRMPKTYEEIEEEVIKGGKGFSSFKRMIVDMLKQARTVQLLVLSIIVTAITSTVAFYAIGRVADQITARNTELLIVYAMVFLSMYVIQFFSNWLRTITSTFLSQNTLKNLRDDAFASLQKVPVSFFSKVKTGYLISRISNDGESLSEFLTFQLPAVLSGVATLVISAGFMLYLAPTLALYSFIVIPILVVFTFSIQPRVRKNYLRTRRAIARITGNLAEDIGAIRAIKSFNIEDKVSGKFRELNSENYEANMVASRLSSTYSAIIRIIEAFGISIVLYEGGLETLHGIVSLGILVSFVFYVQGFFNPVVQLSQTYNAYQSAMVGLTRIYGIIDADKEALPLKPVQLDSFEDSISFRNVSFSYGEGYALNKVNLEIRKGQKIGIVGHTGAGKTTISNLMLKFYHPTDGTIEIDGKNLEEIQTQSYRRLIAPVLQDPFMFRGTVLDNIRFSDPDATREKVMECVERFGLGAIFRRMSNGIDTDIGEMGRNLSEGQRQAISILRAFILNPEILVLDEPTSQIDPQSEKAIINALEKFLRDKTLILITHRFSLIRLVDNVIVLDHGSVVEEGDVPTLLEGSGKFSQLYEYQRQDYELM
jgi:ATP-binding cassette subfamily B protein